MAWMWYVAPPEDPNGNAGKIVWKDGQGNFYVGNTSPDGQSATGGNAAGSGPAPPPPTTGTATTAGPTTGSSIGSAEATYALQVWVEAQKAKADADRLNLLDIPKWQKDAAIAQADQLLRQAAETRASLNDAQRRELDAQTGALNAAKVSGYMQGASSGALIRQGWENAVKNGTATTQQAANIIKQAVPGIDDAGAQAIANWGHDFSATIGRPPTDAEVDARIQQMGFNVGTPTLEREQVQNDALFKALQLKNEFQGPENAFKYAATFANIPDQLRGIIDRAANRIGVRGLGLPPSTAAGVGQTAEDSVRQFVQQYGNGGSFQPLQGGPTAVQTSQVVGQRALPGGDVEMSSGAAPTEGRQYAQVMPGTRSIPTAGVVAPPAASDVDPVTGLTRANQINPLEYQRALPYLQKMTWAGYGAAGADPETEKAKYLASLPKYGTTTSGTTRY